MDVVREAFEWQIESWNTPLSFLPLLLSSMTDTFNLARVFREELKAPHMGLGHTDDDSSCKKIGQITF